MNILTYLNRSSTGVYTLIKKWDNGDNLTITIEAIDSGSGEFIVNGSGVSFTHDKDIQGIWDDNNTCGTDIYDYNITSNVKGSIIDETIVRIVAKTVSLIVA